MDLILTIPAIVWLVFSGILFGFGEFYSKKFALLPSFPLLLLVVFFYVSCSLFWLPAIFQKKELAITGLLWSLISVFMTIIIGVLFFRESISPLHWVGIFFACVSIALLSING